MELLFDPVALLGIVAVLVLVNSVIVLQDHSSYLRCIVQALPCFFLVTRRDCCAHNAEAAAPDGPDERPSFREQRIAEPPAAAARPSFREQRIAEPPAAAARGARIPHEDADLSRGEVKMVMKRLGIFGVADDPGDEKLQERIGATEIARVFEEDEVSLEEVKEAFYVFDGNCDGFVDARELSDVLRALGFVDLSERDCGDLIKAFDENGDGLIDFREFTKLVQRSFRH
ncbi:probable calcium-binding protein CML45 [Syzygium oleosum]|uniref:probable calcium-binding protein CML45 n=1 Tax=Syzygium oleosum TaxID=219896 RepID=UPI0011D27967|nr:probable calcium-binding protein CML45 [Syzygium oleosum]